MFEDLVKQDICVNCDGKHQLGCNLRCKEIRVDGKVVELHELVDMMCEENKCMIQQ